MGAIKAVLHEIAEEAYNKIDDWIQIDSEMYYELDLEEKIDIIEQDLPEYFEKYGQDAADIQGLPLSDYQEFIQDHLRILAEYIVNMLE